MSDIFISYKSERRLAAEHFAEVLKRYGYSVWFDYSLVKGKDFAEQIDRQIRTAKAVVVLWCTRAATSRWVKEEAYLAQKLGILIPVKIETCDAPFGFQLDDPIDLIGWDGSPRSHQLDPLIDDIERKVDRNAAPDRRALMELESHWRRYGAQPLRAFALGRPIEPEHGRLPSLRYETPATEPVRYVMDNPPPEVRQRFKLWAKAEHRREERKAPIPYEDAGQRLVRSFAGHSAWVSSVAFSPDGRLALSGSGDSALKLWDVPLGKELCNFASQLDPVYSVAYSPEGSFALSGSGAFKLWEIGTGKALHSFKGGRGTVMSVAFSRDANFALSGSGDCTLRLWEVGTGKELRSFEGHSYTVNSVAFSPDGRFVLSGSHDNTLKLWDANSGKEVRSFEGHLNTVYSVAYSQDARFVLSGSHDNTLKLWDADTGKELISLAGHQGVVWSVAFSPDGRFALSGSDDTTLKLWDVSRGDELRSFAGHSGPVRSVAFSPDGQFAISGSHDKTLKLWDLSQWTHPE